MNYRASFAPPLIEGDIKNRLTGSLPCIEKRNVVLPYRIGGRVNPTADGNFPPRSEKNVPSLVATRCVFSVVGLLMFIRKYRPNLPFGKEAVVPLHPETVKCRPLAEESVRRVLLSGVDLVETPEC